MSSLPDKLDAALNRRGYTSRSGRSKALACDIGVGDGTLWRYRNGSRAMAAETFLRLVDHFRAQGDLAFASEVLGEPESEIHYWATDRGELHRVENLAVYAAQRRGLEGVEGDHAAAARRNLGWISVATRSGVATVEYHERGLSPRSVSVVAECLRGVGAVARIVALADGPRLTLPTELPRDAIRALEEASAFKCHQDAMPWRVDRLRVEGGMHPSAKKLANLEGSVIDSGAFPQILDLLSDYSLFRVIDGREVICLQVGASSPLPQATKIEYAARPVMSRADIRYAAMVQARVLDAHKNGLRYDQIAGTINGRVSRWRGLTVPIGKDLVATHTERSAA